MGSTTTGAVATAAKKYAAIVGDARPASPAVAPLTSDTLAAYDYLRMLNTASQTKAMAETRLYDSWAKRFKVLVDGGTVFSGTDGFKNIVKCLKETLQTTAPTDDSEAGQSSWAVYHRVSAASQAKLKAAILEQLSASVSAV